MVLSQLSDSVTCWAAPSTVAALCHQTAAASFVHGLHRTVADAHYREIPGRPFSQAPCRIAALSAVPAYRSVAAEQVGVGPARSNRAAVPLLGRASAAHAPVRQTTPQQQERLRNDMAFSRFPPEHLKTASLLVHLLGHFCKHADVCWHAATGSCERPPSFSAGVVCIFGAPLSLLNTCGLLL